MAYIQEITDGIGPNEMIQLVGYDFFSLDEFNRWVGARSLAEIDDNDVVYINKSNGYRRPFAGDLETRFDGTKTIAASIGEVRASSVGLPDAVVITDPLRRGVFYKDAADTLTADDGALTLVASNGTRYKRLTDYVTPEMFGAVGDGVTDDTVAIQAAENYCFSTGRKITLLFKEGDYQISASIQKKSNVDWKGPGKIARIDRLAPTGRGFALVIANNQNDFVIDGISFENVVRDLELSVPLTQTVAIGDWGSCIDLYLSSDFSIKNCTMRKFSQGIVFRGCNRFEIINNHLIAENSKTINSMLAGTYTPFPGYTNTGGIVNSYLPDGPSIVSKDFLISGNFIDATGLDVGIEPLNQVYDSQPSIISNNIIHGPHCGIQVYRGTFTESQTTGAGRPPVTYNSGVQIIGNRIYATWEEGIYLRGVLGTTVIGNIIEHAALLIGGQTGASGGAIVTRVNPRNNPAIFPSAANGTLSDNYPTIIKGNTIINPGREGVNFDAAIQIRIEDCIVLNNIIVRDNSFTTALGFGVFVDNSEKVKNFRLEGNVITGKFLFGVYYVGTFNSDASLEKYSKKINGNQIDGSTNGIYSSSYAIGQIIQGNQILNAITAIRIRYSPYSKIINNIISNCTIGIELQSGNLASDIPRLLTANVITSANYRGGTIEVVGNSINNTATPHTATETNGVEATFDGRTLKWDDVVNGVAVGGRRYTNASQPTTSTAKIWRIGDRAENSSPTTGQPTAKVCNSPGQYGSNTTTTGNTTNGSAIISNIQSLDGLGTGIYVTIAGVTGVKRIVSVDVSNSGDWKVTVDSNCNATTAGAVIAPATPTFLTLPNF